MRLNATMRRCLRGPSPARAFCRRRTQQGQGLVEAIVVCGAMLALFLVIPLIAKYQDVRRTVVASSRTMAFECSIRIVECADGSQLAVFEKEIRRRHFTDGHRSIFTTDDPPAQLTAGNRNRFWTNRRNESLLASTSDMRLAVRAGQQDGVDLVDLAALNWFERGMVRTAEAALSVAGPEAFGLSIRGGMVSVEPEAQVSIGRSVQSWMKRPEGLALTMKGRLGILTDPWNAVAVRGSERAYHERVAEGRKLPGLKRLYKSAQLLVGDLPDFPDAGIGLDLDVDTGLKLFYSPVLLPLYINGNQFLNLDPNGDRFEFHKLDVEVLPKDRRNELNRPRSRE